jgi:hypothetical protein
MLWFVDSKSRLIGNDGEDICSLYDLQFDHDGIYVANGVIVRSRCPRSEVTQLAKDLYFDTEEPTWIVMIMIFALMT